jgi:pyruvate kinase
MHVQVNSVDYFALSFVKDVQVILDVKKCLAGQGSKIKVGG